MKGVIVRVHVTLLDAEPAIWRRLEIPATFTLKGLHDVIQRAMGWCDYHLHHFDFGGVLYGQPLPDDDFYQREVSSERRLKLGTLMEEGDRVFTYAYDYGDGWQCAIVLEAAGPTAEGVIYPRLVDGARAGPPEDVGGVWGYADLFEALDDPEHEEHQQMTEWVGGAFDPERLDVDELNARLARIAPKATRPRKTTSSGKKKPHN